MLSGARGLQRAFSASSSSSAFAFAASSARPLLAPLRGGAPRRALAAMKDARGKTIAKANLPSKICETCNRPMTWRKAWEKCWDTVRHCSDRCRNEAKYQAKLRKGVGGGAVSAAGAGPAADAE